MLRASEPETNAAPGRSPAPSGSDDLDASDFDWEDPDARDELCTCWECDGDGIDPATGDTCWRCKGKGETRKP